MAKVIENVKKSTMHNKNRKRYLEDLKTKYLIHPLIGSKVYKENNFLSKRQDNIIKQRLINFSLDLMKLSIF